MRELTDLEIHLLLSLKSDLMDSDGHDKTNIQAECKAEIEAMETINKVLSGEN